ncbi:MAG: SusE domain-containing protein [Bacteroidales bacterium]|jgi:hypothetical protein|nr:SusE domain-containing protein [Bacteroidales bacterium]
MKSYKLHTYLLVLGIVLCFPGCKDQDDYTITIDTVADGMHLAVSAEEIVLSEDRLDETAITFTWGEAQPRANHGVITYYFKLGLPGFPQAMEKVEMAPGVFTYSISHWDLNVLAFSVGIPYGSTAQLEAEVIASSDEGEFFVKPEISITTFTLTTLPIGTLDKTGWEVTASSEDSPYYEGGGKNAVIDGIITSSNCWIHGWTYGAQLPHWIILDMKSPKTILGIITVRGYQWNNGITKSLRYFIGNSADPNDPSWTEIAYGEYPSAVRGVDSPEPNTLSLNVDRETGQYLKLLIEESFNPPDATICEITVYGIN